MSRGAGTFESFAAHSGLEVHHVNGDPSDNRIQNTVPLCRDCHHEATFPGT